MSFLRPFTFALFALFAFANHAFSTPVITSVGPTFGTPGTTISIAGSGLLDATVHFGSTTAVPTNNTDSEITVDIPQLTPGTIPLFVTNGDGTSNSLPFTVQGSWKAIVTNSNALPNGSLSAITIPATGFPIFSTTITDLGVPTINSPFGIAITPDGTTALAVNGNSNTVSIVDIASNSVTGSILVGAFPRYIAINSSGTIAYVTNSGEGTITPIDLTVKPPSPHPSFSNSPSPTGIAVSFDDKNLYVINDEILVNTLTPFDLTTDPFNPTRGTPVVIPTTNGDIFNNIALTPASAKIQKAFVSVRDSIGANSTVYSFTLDDHPQNPSSAVAISINRSNPAGMAVSQDGTTLYVADSGVAQGHAVSIIDVQHDAWVADINFVSTVNLNNVALTPDGRQLFVTDNQNGGVFPVDLTTVPPIIQGFVTTASGPFAVAITPDQAPHAAFTADEVVFGTATFFDATLSVSPVGSIASYLWDFGDCTPPIVTTSPFITHTYPIPGTFLASLTVTNTAGTSTTQVFPTGQTLSNNGNQNAFACHEVTVLSPPPAVTSMSPTQGPVTGGTVVTITGTDLNCVEEVLFGTIPGGITTIASNGTSLTVLSPAALSPGGVTVTLQTCNGSAVAGPFIYFSVLPTVTGLSPTSGPEIGGTTVTITGTNLTCIQDVKFGGIPGGITSISPLGTSIIVTTPPASAAGPVEVTVDTCDSTLTAGVFTYFSSLPTVTSFAPISGPISGGTSVVITGANLTCVQNVKFGGIPGGITHISPQGTSITVTTPGASEPGPVEVTIEACSSTLSIGTFIYQQETTTLVCPPRDVHGVQEKSRHGLANILTWKAPKEKCGEGLPSAYRIYRNRELTDLLGTVTAHAGQVNFKFKDFDPKKGKKSYYIVSVDQFGNQSLPVMVTVRPKERHSSHSSRSD